ncbi:MAG: hypothetical protein QOG99_2704 [Frankiales bacterium]|nr:hypothetical protein [Frankiales bacterium]
MPLPTFVGVGASKSGTTSLARWLEAHPDVYVTPAKELRFFTLHWERGLDWYEECFADAAGRPAGEITPDYLADPVALDRLSASLPDAQVIVCLREPVARLLSHYWHQRMRGSERRPLLEATGGSNDYVSRSDYLPQLEHLGRAVPRERIHVVLFDELRDQPEEAFAGTCRFLGVDDAVRPEVLGQAFNTAAAFRSRRLRIEMLRAGAFTRAPALSRRLDAWNRKSVEYPPPTGTELRELRARCGYDRPALESWLGRALPEGWT